MTAPRQAEGTVAPPAPSPACRSCAITVGLGHGPCPEHAPPNPFAGRHACPSCGSAAWTLPTSYPGLGPWRCCSCGMAWDPAAEVAA